MLRNDSANRLTLLNIYLYDGMKVRPGRKKRGKKDNFFESFFFLLLVFPLGDAKVVCDGKEVKFSCVPNPPLSPKCVVCGVRKPKHKQGLEFQYADSFFF